MDADAHDVTRILRQLADGDASASDRLLPLVYEELRRRAEIAMGSPVGQTLQPTALVHEAWMRMAPEDGPSYESRGHFVSVAAKAMRQILIDRARRRGARKRGGDGEHAERVTIRGVEDETGPEHDVLDLSDALSGLEEAHPRPARIAELRFFGGLEMAEIAAVLGASERTVYNDWRLAKAWLRRALRDDAP